ncbi:MAG: SIS domain-containing protein [Cyclobacteriaceae bacterium]
MLKEIKEIPQKARLVYEQNVKLSLPAGAPYIGMGSSYYATLALYYQGISVIPEVASEFYNYRKRQSKPNLGVLISQSGRSSEVLWCSKLFNNYMAITNVPDSPLAKEENVSKVVDIMAGPERHSSTKTYINTLITLYRGHKLDPGKAVEALEQNINKYEDWGAESAEKIYQLINKREQKGLFIIGNGPNIATANQSALILSESTRYGFAAMPVSQFDHGPKESARNSVVIAIDTPGPGSVRTQRLLQLVKNAGGLVIHLQEDEIAENFSPITTIMPMNFLTYHLAKKLSISKTFSIGSKVTEAEKK